MATTVNLDKNNFELFVKGLSLLKDLCNDVDIRDGVIRQRTGDNTTIFEINMQKLIGNVNIPISSIKQNLELFRIFNGQDVEMIIDDNHFEIRGNISIKLMYPSLDFMDNQYMSKEELNQIFPINEEERILTTEIPKIISDQTRIISQSFAAVSIQVEFKGQKAKISSKTQSKDKFAAIIEDIIPDVEMNATSNLVVTPFIIEHEGNINFSMYEMKKDRCVNEFKTSLSDSIDINVYSTSSLIESE